MNSEFDVTVPKGYVVLAIKRAIKDGKSFSEVVYTPYSKELDAPEVRARGQQHLDEILISAQNQLMGVKSRAVKGKNVIDVVPLSVAKVLFIIEHVDPFAFSRGDETPAELVDRVYTIIGLNLEDAYMYSVSKARARGISQFIPSTYARLRAQYPEVALISNFVEGTQNQVNAAKAALLLFDSDISVLDSGLRAKIMADPQYLGRFLAAAYNGGAGRAEKAIKKYGDDRWTDKLLPETITYVQKHDAVAKVLMALASH